MNIILIMIALSVALLGVATVLFFWAVDNDQFDDLQTPALLPLDDCIGSDDAASNDPGTDCDTQSSQCTAR